MESQSNKNLFLFGFEENFFFNLKSINSSLPWNSSSVQFLEKSTILKAMSDNAELHFISSFRPISLLFIFCTNIFIVGCFTRHEGADIDSLPCPSRQIKYTIKVFSAPYGHFLMQLFNIGSVYGALNIMSDHRFCFESPQKGSKTWNRCFYVAIQSIKPKLVKFLWLCYAWHVFVGASLFTRFLRNVFTCL